MPTADDTCLTVYSHLPPGRQKLASLTGTYASFERERDDWFANGAMRAVCNSILPSAIPPASSEASELHAAYFKRR